MSSNWICEASAAFDASQVLQPSLGDVAAEASEAGNFDAGVHPAGVVRSLEQFMEREQLPLAIRGAITKTILATGAFDVEELTR